MRNEQAEKTFVSSFGICKVRFDFLHPMFIASE
jgi:hypothetical protein